MIRSQRSDLLIGQHSSTGADRINQDSYAIVSFEPVEPRMGRITLAVIADGRGQSGEVASQIVVAAIVEQFSQSDVNDVLAGMKKGFRTALEKLVEIDSPAGVMCTVLAVVDRKLYWAAVGECRIFLIREGHIEKLTPDNLVERLVELGQLTEEEATGPVIDDSLPQLLNADHVYIEPRSGQKALRRTTEIIYEDMLLKAGDQILIISTGVFPRYLLPRLYSQYRFDLFSQSAIHKLILMTSLHGVETMISIAT